jgi:putative transcription antitermination factor YqgF
MKLLAIDYGTRRLGLALAENPPLALPYGTHTRRPNDVRGDIAALIDLMRARAITDVVVGRPGGSAASDAMAGQAQKFAARLQESAALEGLNLTFHFWDERYTTSAALQGLSQAGLSQKAARESTDSRSVDARAAALILQGYLDATAPGNEEQGTP